MTGLARIALSGVITAPARRRRGLLERISIIIRRLLA